MAKPRKERFDPSEVDALIDKAKAGDIEARNELLHRFQRLIATLVNVCITGRPNYRSSYQLTFLRLFAGKSTPIQDTASMLKTRLVKYEKGELFSTGQLAILTAIEKTKTNLASTIVSCFKDLIYKMIKDPQNSPTDDLELLVVKEAPEAEMAFNIFLSSLNEEEREAAMELINGNESEVPDSLKEKLLEWVKYD